MSYKINTLKKSSAVWKEFLTKIPIVFAAAAC